MVKKSARFGTYLFVIISDIAGFPQSWGFWCIFGVQNLCDWFLIYSTVHCKLFNSIIFLFINQKIRRCCSSNLGIKSIENKNLSLLSFKEK
jgi:hypothetical protein